ncbi:hypothetical protein CYMTET_48873 [Cymbomonas tetramitiformis]|uniref:MHD domain-containing protein n=1 Tax=Cymbomonas tetramitiformis TaxID=36881 RepID=A0AAE0BSL4_9CHLO|nr:hypothetical protein CYMTET_48873 [Cymbomonas tetramitiformis]
MISQVVVLSLRGDTIISRNYRDDVPKNTAETFFRKVRFWGAETEGRSGESAPPVFNSDGVNYYHIKTAGLFFVAMAKTNAPPSLILELIQRVAAVIKDYCGTLSEDVIRKNFILVYELLDELIDFGYGQNTSTEYLKSYIFNEPLTVTTVAAPGKSASIFAPNTRSAAAATSKSVVEKPKKGVTRDEIFVDIVEKVSVTFNASGYLLTSAIDGSIKMKSYLSGNPDIRVALNEDLAVGSTENSPFAGDYGKGGGVSLLLDDCNFHSCARLKDFDADRTITLTPPDGEFVLMNYRTTHEFKPPFKIYTAVEEVAPYVAELVIKVRAEFPASKNGSNVVLKMPLPKATTRASCHIGPGQTGQTTEWKESTKEIQWSFKKISGGSDHALRVKLTLSEERVPNIKREMGPVSLSFTIAMYNVSRLVVRYLQILNKEKGYNPYRWVRYVTQSSSYISRI